MVGIIDKPKRIKRSRRLGWRKPAGAVIVDRTSRWGNPFKLSPDGWILYKKEEKIIGSFWCYWSASSGFGKSDVVDLYAQWIHGKLQEDHPYLPTPPSIEELKGKDLVCFCNLDQPCHADYLLEIANK